MSNEIDEKTLFRHALSVVVEFMHSRFPEFRSKYAIGLKTKELSYLSLKKPGSKEYQECLDELDYLESAYGDGTFPLVENKDNIIPIPPKNNP